MFLLVFSFERDTPVGTSRIWPIGFDCNSGEAFLRYQALREVCPMGVEFVGAMGTISDQDDLCGAFKLHVSTGRPKLVAIRVQNQWPRATPYTSAR
jgi:hypothetical protein